MLTITKLNNKILRICPRKEAAAIIQHCNKQDFNKARIIIEGLEEEIVEDIGSEEEYPNEYETVEGYTKVDKYIAYQEIWNELVNQIENSHG